MNSEDWEQVVDYVYTTASHIKNRPEHIPTNETVELTYKANGLTDELEEVTKSLQEEARSIKEIHNYLFDFLRVVKDGKYDEALCAKITIDACTYRVFILWKKLSHLWEKVKKRASPDETKET